MYSSQNAVIHQNSLYNYTLKDKENKVLKEERKKLIQLIFIAFFLCLLLSTILVIIYMFSKNTKLAMALQSSKISHIKKQEVFSVNNCMENPTGQPTEVLNNILQKQFDDIITGTSLKKHVQTESILKSNIYNRIQTILNTKGSLTINEWKELSHVVNNEYPDFKNKLYLLNSKISTQEYRVCLLIKIGLIPNDIAKLLNRSKEAICSTRRRLCYKCFFVKSTPENFDKFIHSL